MSNRGFSFFISLFIIPAICLQPRVGLAQGDYSGYLSDVVGRLDTLTHYLQRVNGGQDYIKPYIVDMVDDVNRVATMQNALLLGLSAVASNTLPLSTMPAALSNAVHGAILDGFSSWSNSLGSASIEIWEPFYAWTNFFLSFFPYRGDWSDFLPSEYGMDAYYSSPWVMGLDPLETRNFPEFLSFTLGGLLDGETFYGDWSEWEDAFNIGHASTPEVLGNWYWWMAEAQRRQLAAASNTAWNVQQLGAAIMASNVLQSPGWTGTDTSNASDWSDAVNDYESMQALPDPEDDPGQASPPDIEEAVPELEWELEGASPQEIALFEFSALNREYSGSLVVDFTGRHWTVIRLVCSFCWSVLFATGMFMIVRNEWNFWTTLGGSAT